MGEKVKLTKAELRLLRRLPANVPFGTPEAVSLIMAGLAYRAAIHRLLPSDAGRQALEGAPDVQG